MVAYTAIFAAAMSGYAALGLWAVALTALALIALSQAEYGRLYRRGRDIGLVNVTHATMLQSAMNALIASGTAYAVGILLRLL